MLLSESKFFHIWMSKPPYTHSSKFSFILINFATDLFSKQGKPPLASNVVSRKRLKSPASIICLFW